jgi:hypothetical protein
MSFEVNKAFVNQYTSNLEHLAQQKGSRLRESVRVEDGITGKSVLLDFLGPTSAQRRTSRHADTPLISTPHSRRKIWLNDYDWADLIDNTDKLKMLVDPQSEYARAGAFSLGRAMDDEIIAAAGGNSISVDENDAETNVALPSGQIIVHGSAGLTISKLISAKSILGQNDVDPEEELYFWLTQKQLDDLLATTEVKSADYNSVRALVKGEVDTFMGFKFIRTQRLLKVSTTRYCYAVAKGGMALAVGQDIQGRVDQRPDKNYAWQIWANMSIGAGRLDEYRVVQVQCTES